MWNTSVKEITGGPERLGVEKVKVEDTKTGNINIIKADAVFVAIGYEPNNDIAEKLGLKMDVEGYIKVDDKMRTSMPLVYAAGDITGGVKQIVTAVSQGAVAALTAFEDIANPYWKKQAGGSESGYLKQAFGYIIMFQAQSSQTNSLRYFHPFNFKITIHLIAGFKVAENIIMYIA